MKHRIAALLCLLMAIPTVVAAATAAKGGGDEPPASFSVQVSPDPVSPGGATEVRLVLKPASGVKINKYPRVKLKIPAAPGLVEEAEGSVGSDAPPPPDRLEENYFTAVDPVLAKIRIDPHAGAGRHEVDAKLSYFYCVSASGYCAPAKVAVKIPIEIR